MKLQKNPEEIKFELTSPGTPHQNGVVEQGFDTFYSQMREMTAQAVLHENLNTVLWHKWVETITNLKIVW